MLLAAAAIAAFPLLLYQLLDSIFITGNHAILQSAAVMMILLFTIHAAAVYIKRLSIGKTGSLLTQDLRLDVINKLLALPINQGLSFPMNHRIDQLIACIHQVSPGTAFLFAQLLQDCLIIAVLVLCTLYLNQDFAMLLVLIAPLLALIYRLADDSGRAGQQNLSAIAGLLQHLSQAIGHHRTIRLDGGIAQESERLEKISGTIQLEEMRQTKRNAMATLFSQTIAVLILVAAGYAVGFQAINGALSLPQTGALVTATLLLVAPVRRILKIPRKLEHHREPLETIFAFLDQPLETDTGTLDIPRFHGKLQFEKICYDDKAESGSSLNHINFTIEPGNIAVFKGYSTGEKTSLIDLILRLQQPVSGKIWLDDHPLEQIRLDSLHANIAMVSPDTFLLDDKVAGNIAYGAKRCSNEAAITAAAQASRAVEFIRHLRAGLQTQVTLETNEITPQQLLQLSIARAFVKNTPILILDEVFALTGCDSGELLPVLENLMENRTTLIFSQQIPQQLKKIDRIIVLENGSITKNLRTLDSYHP